MQFSQYQLYTFFSMDVRTFASFITTAFEEAFELAVGFGENDTDRVSVIDGHWLWLC